MPNDRPARLATSLVAFILAIGTLMVAASPAAACTGAPLPLVRQWRESAAVFQERLLSWEAGQTEFAVINAWKGAPPVRTSVQNLSCRYPFDVEGEYVVWASHHEGRLITSTFSGNAPITQAGSQLRFLAGTREPQPWSTALVPTLVALAITGVVGFKSLRSWSGGHIELDRKWIQRAGALAAVSIPFLCLTVPSFQPPIFRAVSDVVGSVGPWLWQATEGGPPSGGPVVGTDVIGTYVIGVFVLGSSALALPAAWHAASAALHSIGSPRRGVLLGAALYLVLGLGWTMTLALRLGITPTPFALENYAWPLWPFWLTRAELWILWLPATMLFWPYSLGYGLQLDNPPVPW